MDLGIRDKVAAVAAATSGLGLATALELAREGARVAICSRDSERLKRALSTLALDPLVLRYGGDRIAGVAVDLAHADGAAQLLDRARSAFGRVDIAVANCGGPPPGSALGFDDEAWRSGFELTFLSSARLARGAAEGMKERRWGRIIFITSVSVKQPIGDLAMSTSLRSAVVGYSKMLSDELSSFGITVNCVAPGSTLTERLTLLLERRARARGVTAEALRVEEEAKIPSRRFGKPEELAAAVAFLASERASYITGTVLPVDGGLVRSLT